MNGFDFFNQVIIIPLVQEEPIEDNQPIIDLTTKAYKEWAELKDKGDEIE